MLPKVISIHQQTTKVKPEPMWYLLLPLSAVLDLATTTLITVIAFATIGGSFY